MKIPKFVLNEIDSGRLVIEASGAYRLYCIIGDEDECERDIDETLKVAEKLVDFSERNGSKSAIINSDWGYCKKDDWGWGSFCKVCYVCMTISEPVSNYLTEKIAEQENCNKIEYNERCRIKFLTSFSKDLPKCNRIGYVRADHDKYQWWGKWFDGEKSKTAEVELESQYVYMNIIRMFPNGVSDMQYYIHHNIASALSDKEANLYYDGKYADYWIRLNAQQGDYNIYLYCYEK